LVDRFCGFVDGRHESKFVVHDGLCDGGGDKRLPATCDGAPR
jgi:hypothetical protein